MLKISVIMPTFNDAETIRESLDSVINQTYADWQLIIVDDGSTDSTAQIIKDYRKEKDDNRIEYHFQDNQDQLNAIQNALEYVDGHYIYLLHSDDKLTDCNSFLNFIEYEKNNPGFDAYYGDMIVINQQGQTQTIQHIMKYRNNNARAALLYLWLGRNLYIDFAFFHKEIFFSKVRNSYLKWNIPYWLDLNSSTKCLNVKKFDFPMFQYRVFEGNYINSELGMLNVVNGELRTLTSLMKVFYIPCYRLQYLLYRCFNKIKIGSFFRPLYINKEEKNKGRILEFVIKKRFGDSYKNNIFLDSLVKFYQTLGIKRTIEVAAIPEDLPIYRGSDMRTFNKKLLAKELHPFYINFMEEMQKGFDQIKCREQDIVALNDICTFMCIDKLLKIES